MAVIKNEESNMVERDKLEIIEIMNLYGAALDAQDWDLFDRIFSEDVTAVFGPAGAGWQGLSEFKRSFAEFHLTLDSHQHTMMGHLVHVEGDKAYAFSYGNWLLTRDAAIGGPNWLGTGWYDDELVRGEHGWRITRRVCRLMAWTGNPAVPEPNHEHKPDMKTNILRHHVAAGEVGYFNAIKAKK
jgi:ketosteroid isomerase-like protein